ncbi:MAG: ATP-binding cassette domain-containing protein [Phycisphaerales bacterium]|jgi:ABC-2 type transport system ATP-binding protein|nr:ATP-binding cassette domain-containing protein [Phycisphaerales bacterium]
MTNAVQIRGVSKSFGQTNAVVDVDLDVPQGSLCGFLGPNGAGKSTTIRMLMSIIHADQGTVEVLGTNALKSKDRIGYLPEERGVYRKMKVGHFVEYIGRLKGVAGCELKKQTDTWLERVELPGIRNKRCEELSKGMQQKVQFLAAIIHEPELIILDEPFSGLDPVNARVIGQIIDELHQQGRTILFSTHVLSQAEKICDRIVMIDQGKKVLDGTVSSIQSQFDPRVIRIEPTDMQCDLHSIHGATVIKRNEKEKQILMRLQEGAEAPAILSQIVQQQSVQGIEIVRPTLDEIFIEQVERNRGHEAALQVREEMKHV